MSKSLGNFYTLRDLTQRGFTGREIRYVLASAHYRQTLNFTFESLEAARSALRRVDEFRERLAAAPPDKSVAQPEWITQALAAFRGGLDNDLNTAEAIAALFDMVHTGNRMADAGKLTSADAAAALAALDEMDRVFGFLTAPEQKPDEEVVRLAEERLAARRRRDWPESDRLRDLIAERGWVVQDVPDGYKLKPRV